MNQGNISTPLLSNSEEVLPLICLAALEGPDKEGTVMLDPLK